MRALRSFTVPIAGLMVLVALVSAPLGATAAGTQVFHENFSEPVDDFIWGFHITGTAEGVNNIFERVDSNGVDLVKVTHRFKGTFTLDNGDGTGTLTVVESGMPGRLITGDRSLDVKDVGRLERDFLIDLTTGEFLSQTVIFEAGPHPELNSDFTLVCNTIAALAQ